MCFSAAVTSSLIANLKEGRNPNWTSMNFERGNWRISQNLKHMEKTLCVCVCIYRTLGFVLFFFFTTLFSTQCTLLLFCKALEPQAQKPFWKVNSKIQQVIPFSTWYQWDIVIWAFGKELGLLRFKSTFSHKVYWTTLGHFPLFLKLTDLTELL